MKLEELIKAQGRLNEKEFLIYNSELKKNLKSTWKAYFFLLFFGWFGFHKFYLEKSDEGILYLIVGLISLNADFNFDLDKPNLSTLTFLVQIIHLMYDLFTIPSNISKYEINLRTELLGEFGIFFNKFYMEIDDLSEAENTLSENDFLEYNLLLEKKIINVEQAYIGLFFVGWLGLHKFLFGKILQGISYLCMFSIGLYALVLHIVTGAPIYRPFFMIYVFFLIWDSFLLYSEVYVHNQEVRKELLAEFGIFIKFKNKKEKYEKELKNSLDDLTQQIDTIKKIITPKNGENMSCPKCGSDNWKMASLIHAEGLSGISSSTLGVGGASSNLFGDGVGIGIGSTSATQQSKLSELAAPPTASPFSGLFFLMALIFLAYGNKSSSDGFLLFGLIFGGIGIMISISDDKRISEELPNYPNKKMCLRCGTFFFDDITTSDNSFKSSSFTKTPINKEKKNVNETKKCPFCAEEIKADAIRCKHCRSDIIPPYQAKPDSIEIKNEFNVYIKGYDKHVREVQKAIFHVICKFIDKHEAINLLKTAITQGELTKLKQFNSKEEAEYFKNELVKAGAKIEIFENTMKFNIFLTEYSENALEQRAIFEIICEFISKNEAMEILDKINFQGVPISLKNSISKSEAEAFKNKLQAAGAKADLKPTIN